MSDRITAMFEARRAAGRTALVPFVTAGDPHPEDVVGLMHALVAGGADLIELGVPFSDPMADGPVIQAASERAIGRGVDLGRVLEAVAAFREDDADTPVILMGYLNPIERMGPRAFAERAQAAGVDGVLVVDCPPEERGELGEALAAAGIAPITMIAPTTPEARVAELGAAAGGFVYYVSFKGITGASRLDAAALAEPLARIRRHCKLPVAVGFGIKDAAGATAVAAEADAVVIGSALVAVLAETADAEAANQAARGFLAPIRQALDNGAHSEPGASHGETATA